MYIGFVCNLLLQSEAGEEGRSRDCEGERKEGA